MIPKKYNGEYLIGRKCRPVRSIRNGGGDVISPDTVCKIRNVVRGSGISVITEPCRSCGQSTYITRISREDLELIDESPLGRAKELLRIRTEAAQKFLTACTDIDVFCKELGMDVFNPEFCLGMDFRIWGETDGCYQVTLDAITTHIKENAAQGSMGEGPK